MTAAATAVARPRARSGVKRERGPVAYPLLLAVLALVALGVVMVYSASSVREYLGSNDSAAEGMQQAVWAVLGLGCLYLFSRLDFRLLRHLALPGYFLSIILLVAVLFLGTEMFGSRRWFVIPGIG